MSKLDQLINELCPEGVALKKMWEVTIWDKKFSGVKKEQQKETRKYKYFLAKELEELYSKNGNIKVLTTYKSELFVDEKEVVDVIVDDEIICIPWGGNPIVQYYNGKFITSDNRIAVAKDKQQINIKYLYYFMENNMDKIGSFYRGSGIKHPSMASILDMDIPLPPLGIQDEIVCILDKFTELTARKKQYEYYKTKLLTFESNVEWKNITEIFNIQGGYTPSKSVSKYWDEGTIPWYRMDDIRKNGRILDKSLQHITKSGARKIF